MAKDTRWLGGTVPTGDPDIVANWDNGVPVDTDTVFFDTGAWDLDVPFDDATIDLAAIYLTDGYTGNIKMAAGAEGLVIDSVLLYDRGGSGEHWFDGTYPTAMIDNSSSDDDAVHIDGSVTTLNLFRGNVTLDTGMTATTIIVGYSGSQSSDVSLTIEAAVTNTTIYQNGGEITDASAWTNLYIIDGEFTHTDTSATNVFMWDGTFNFDAVGHVLTQVYAFGGRFDATEDPNGKTVTDLEMWPGSVVDLRNQTNSIVVTNGVQVMGGRLLVDSNTNLT